MIHDLFAAIRSFEAFFSKASTLTAGEEEEEEEVGEEEGEGEELGTLGTERVDVDGDEEDKFLRAVPEVGEVEGETDAE